MELFKTLICNFIYFHRNHRFGDRDFPILRSFVMILVSIIFILTGTASLLSKFIGIYVSPYITMFSSFIITLFLFVQIMCGKRCVKVLNNRKYYTKKRRIFTLCFYIGCFFYFILCLGLGLARNRGDI